MDLLLPIRLVVAHILGDFLLQPDSWVADRNEKNFRSKALYLHGLIHFLLVMGLAGTKSAWWIGLIIGAGHILLDGFKALIKQNNLWSFLIDQSLHFLIIFLCWNLAEGTSSFYLIEYLLSDFRFWWLLTGYLLNILLYPRIIAFATMRWREHVPPERELLYKAGRWIGILERTLVFTLVLVGQYAAVGFFMAAKSVFRFGDLKDGKDKGQTEYVLIGTLLSVGLA
jgi:hypothetical protein